MKILLQRDNMDCGPTCLAMIVEYFGRDVNRDHLRECCALGKDGVSLLGISKAAEAIGLKTIGGRTSFDSLTQEFPLPCIVHWNQNHFVVVYKIKKRKGLYSIYVADPSKGLMTYTKEEFCKHWISTQTDGIEKGIALLFEPTEYFYAQRGTETTTRGRIHFLWNYLRKYKPFFN